MIYGQFTNWEARRMIGIKDFCKIVQLNPIQIMHNLHNQGKVSKLKKNYDELDEGEQEVYLKELEKHTKTSEQKRWSQILFDAIPQTNPLLVYGQRVLDSENLGTLDLDRLFIYVDVIRPGHHSI